MKLKGSSKKVKPEKQWNLSININKTKIKIKIKMIPSIYDTAMEKLKEDRYVLKESLKMPQN